MGWYSVGEKCIRWTMFNKLPWYESYDYCQHIGAELVTWRTEGEYLNLKYFMNELAVDSGGIIGNLDVLSWTGANNPLWNPWNEFIFNNDTMDFVPMTYGWAEGEPNHNQDGEDMCVRQNSEGEMINSGCGNGACPMCQAV